MDIGPLLELDDHRVAWAGGRRLVAGEHGVQAQGAQGQLVLEDDPVVLKARVVHEPAQAGQGVLPGRVLGCAGLVTELRLVLDRQLLRDAVRHRVPHELLGRPRVELHGAPCSLCWGVSSKKYLWGVGMFARSTTASVISRAMTTRLARRRRTLDCGIGSGPPCWAAFEKG